MATSRTKTSLLTLALAATLTIGANAEITRIDTFNQARSEAKSADEPLVVFVHGKSWHPASERFLEGIWHGEDLASLIQGDVVMTDVHIRQNLTKEEAERDKKSREGWVEGRQPSYPAVQVYSPEGQLLAHLKGANLRDSAKPEQLAPLLNPILDAARQREKLLATYESAKKADDQKSALEALCELVLLPINPEPKMAEMFAAVDPDDTSGWQSRLQFKGWNYMRDVTKQLNEGKAELVLEEAENLLKNSHFTKEQRALILGAKARALTSQGQLKEAWATFQQAAKLDQDGPNGKALLKYGRRAAGIPSRTVFEPGSPLATASIGENLTAGRASYTLSSQAHDDGAAHHTLFSGAFARKGAAFHTAKEAGAHIVIDLDGLCELRAMRITNRSNIHERADGLTVWASNDKSTWTKVWQADSIEASWDVLLDSPVDAAFLKIGLPQNKSNFLHLRGVDAFGTRK
ncbi:discoidin domain-containing protein [Sulfuriroseicoccus oceanibius]|uniref:Uncharacterized protein n=1 Tax=Sulfuriroseicoccus oceanibius TaxID=2707525 RepID=A0A6B3LDT7_9BACT|nr:discoidin domain-containing protein [Sulfuriroseicoccus oceanibius]QQL45248.1 hypothetical protein G3M56_001275 [Sulfuriroseicoccus oceanibius]